MVFGLCSAGTEFYDFTKTNFELLKGCILQKFVSQSLARLFATNPDFNHRGGSSAALHWALGMLNQSILRQ